MMFPLLQSVADLPPDISRRAADVLQVLTAGGVTACVAMLWKFGGRLTAIETTLNDPELGVKSNIVSLRKSRHNDGNTLQQHEVRLDGHDRDIERLDTQFSDRRSRPHDPKPLDRRSST